MLFFGSFCCCSCTTEVASRDNIRLTWHTSSYNKMGQTNVSTPYKLKGSKQKHFLQKGNRGRGVFFHGVVPLSSVECPGLSKVECCCRKSPPTWLVSDGYSAWHFFTDGIFNIKYPWTSHLL